MKALPWHNCTKWAETFNESNYQCPLQNWYSLYKAGFLMYEDKHLTSYSYWAEKAVHTFLTMDVPQICLSSNLFHHGSLTVKDFMLKTWHDIRLLKLVNWQSLAFKISLTQLWSLYILICLLERVLCPVLTFQDLCIIVCCSKFQGIIWSCFKVGVFPVVLPTSFPQLTFEHFPVFRVKYCHEFIHTGHRSQLLFQIFACMSLSK